MPLPSFPKTLLQLYQETLRFDNLVPLQTRCAAKDIIVPLSEPIRTKDGRYIQEVPLKKGTRVIISVTQYNRHPELWGQDSQVWNPDRWLKKNGIDDSIKYGVFANLGTFGAGIRACIGWRFAIYQFQTFVIELINRFQFELTEEAKNAQAMYGLILIPVIKGMGSVSQTSLPLKVSVAA